MLALTQAAPLRPDIRLQHAIVAYEKCLTPQQLPAFQELRREGAPKAIDIIRLTAEIDREAGQRHKSWRSKGGRLTNIFNAIDMFTSAGDILIGGSQNMIACGVWAAIRVSLQVSYIIGNYNDIYLTLLQ